MKLIDCKAEKFYRGTIIRFNGKYPFTEEFTDFMIVDYPQCDNKHCSLALYCISGYYAGSLEYVFPLEAKANDSMSIDKGWLVDNWNEQIYAECSVDEIEVLDSSI